MALLSDQPPRLALPAVADPVFAARLVTVLTAAELRGRGGGAFPTATKISSALAGRQRTARPQLIINACDGEPDVAKDETLIRLSPGLVADGVALVARAVDAGDIIFAAHRGSPAETMLDRLVAGEPVLRGASVIPVPPRYVASEASALAALVTGAEARPLFHREPLSSRGPAGVPTLVLNAETVAQIALIWHGQQATTRLLTVTGAVGAAGVLEVPSDWTLSDIVDEAGGLTDDPRAVLLGGYGGTWVSWAESHSRTLGELAVRGIPTGAGLISVLGQECPVVTVGRGLSYLAAESAGQCGPCMFGLPAIAADWRELSQPRLARAARERLRRRLPVIDGRGACRHPDGAVRNAASALEVFADHLDRHVAGFCGSDRDLVAAS